MEFPIVIQHRHVHLSIADAEELFGPDVSLTSSRPLNHRGQFLCNETVDVVGPDGAFEHVRILGPFRDHTQIELSAADAFAIGIDAPVRISGDLHRSATCTLRGPHASNVIKSQVIIPARHLHCNDQTARILGVVHHQVVSVQLVDDARCTLEHVVVRVHPTFANELHLSADEAAQHWLQSHHRTRVC